MMRKFFLFALVLLFGGENVFAGNISQELKNSVIGSAYSESASYTLLGKICSEAGGRLAGSPQAKKALGILEDFLDKYSVSHYRDNFKCNGFERSCDDRMKLVSPFEREIRGYALGYSKPCEKTEGEVIVVNGGTQKAFSEIDAKGKIILFHKDKSKNITRKECLKNAAEAGAKAVLYPADKKGGMVLIATANFDATEAPVTAFCITKEDDLLLEKQINDGLHPRMEIYVKSQTKATEMTNLRAVFRGKSDKKVILIAHYDSWDLGTGAIDNGSGTVVLADIARLISTYSPKNYYTVECVWTDGEEMGIFGATDLANKIGDSVVAVLNMDMPGQPNGVSTMGHEELHDFVQNFTDSLPGFNFYNGVNSSPWLGSDHQPFMILGIPTFTFGGLPDDLVYKHYHDYGDTFDKANPKYLADAVAVFVAFGLELANKTDLEKFRYSETDARQMLIKYKLDESLKKMGQWNEK